MKKRFFLAVLLVCILLLAITGSAFAAGGADKGKDERSPVAGEQGTVENTDQDVEKSGQGMGEARVKELTGTLEGDTEDGFVLKQGDVDIDLIPNNPAVAAKLILYSGQDELGDITVRGLFKPDSEDEMLVLSVKGGSNQNLGQTVRELVYNDGEGTGFQDVGPGYGWADKSIRAMFKHKIMAGVGDNKFEPNNHVTRAQFAKILVNSLGMEYVTPDEQTFTDVNPEDWFYKYVETACENDCFTGLEDGGEFNPDEPAVREAMAAAIVKALGLELAEDLSAIEDFEDFEDISEDLRVYVATAVENELMEGYEDKTFRPEGTLTRAEAAVLMDRVIELAANLIE